MAGFNPKWIIGRKIIAVEMHPFEGENHLTAHAPVITLDNGARIFFVTEETGLSEYGTAICYRPAPKLK
jgi:hypothetical protein